MCDVKIYWTVLVTHETAEGISDLEDTSIETCPKIEETNKQKSMM